LTNVFETACKVSLFGLRAAIDSLRRPFEGGQIVRQISEVGSKSLLLVIAAGFALGAVMTLHTRSTLAIFGSTSVIPTVQAFAFFLETGPLVTGLLVAGRVGSGIGAVLANMRATEQIDGIESLSIDSFKFLVVPRILACTLALPILTIRQSVTGAASNVNDLVAGMKAGQGPVGMLLRDEALAGQVREAMKNMQQATADLSHASHQVDAMISDLNSQQIRKKPAAPWII
jgi:ABC-type transporter Mla maintaining outer membrane lipid asymmetry permease subunit MlaE